MLVSQALSGADLPTADAEVLLARLLRKDRTWVLAHPEYELTTDEWKRWAQWVQRRRTFEPVAYITGEQEFYGRSFYVDKRVLIPRPATEAVVTTALEFLRDGKERRGIVDNGIIVTATRTASKWQSTALIADIGTGSGCIAVTLAAELPTARVLATDVSADALDVAKKNAERHGVNGRMTFLEGDGFEPLLSLHEPFLVVCNPPYIPAGTKLMHDVEGHEPHVALFGGKEGIDVVQSVREAAMKHPLCIGLVMECEEHQS